jgi:hypothetical protein
MEETAMSEAQDRGMLKYNKDAPFSDPVVRCDSCQRLVLRNDIGRIGGCSSCGNRRVKNVLGIENNPEQSASGVDELALITKWAQEGKIDPDWVAIFTPIEGETQ